MIQYDYYSFLLFCIGKKGKQQDLINIMSTSLVASQSFPEYTLPKLKTWSCGNL